jgi:integrase
MPARGSSKSTARSKKTGTSPAPGARARRSDKARRTETIKFLTFDETKRLFSRITDKRDKALFLTAYCHGLRASEVGLLRVEDLDFKRLKIMLHRLKGSLSGEHPLQPDEARALKARLKSRARLPQCSSPRQGTCRSAVRCSPC